MVKNNKNTKNQQTKRLLNSMYGKNRKKISNEDIKDLHIIAYAYYDLMLFPQRKVIYNDTDSIKYMMEDQISKYFKKED